ncbi:hypothetical protein EDD28_1673 [Salana multivorans]|uniref:Uncharacterized protein n=1 Tax=Salana multivorans TaxID=120377 RepID=A0A3N2DB99_9MICO|nr:hypothetical protein [Salana multivorans]ROR97080.1 hypothetical protein EDD28_1673 [Salana multivorans]
MGFFESWKTRKREQVMSDRRGAAVDRFWTWWSEDGRARALATLVPADDAGDAAGDDARETRVAERNDLVREIAAHADAIGLAFEMGPGREKLLALAFTPGGDPAKQELADRWLAGAPADPQVTYDNRRQPVPDPTSFEIQIGSTDAEAPPHTIDFAGARVRARRRADGKVDVYVTHDAFDAVPDDVAGQVTFIFLDSVLGERVVEESIGVIEHGSVHHDDEVELLALRGIVAG